MKKACLGGFLGFTVGLILVNLLEYGIDSSDAFSLISAFLLFPFIFLLGLPWNLLIGENGKQIVAIGGIGIGIIINSTILGACIFPRWRPSEGNSRKPSS